MTLDDAGLVLPTQTRPLRALGFEAMHDSIFVAKAQGNDQRVSQRIWLFRNRGGAMAWLDKTREDASSLQFSPLTAPVLGDESWAAQGLIQVGGGQAITHAFQARQHRAHGVDVRRGDTADRGGCAGGRPGRAREGAQGLALQTKPLRLRL